MARRTPAGNRWGPPTLALLGGHRFVWVEELFVKVSDLVDAELGISSRSRFGGRLSGGPMTGDNSRQAYMLACSFVSFVRFYLQLRRVPWCAGGAVSPAFSLG